MKRKLVISTLVLLAIGSPVYLLPALQRWTAAASWGRRFHNALDEPEQNPGRVWIVRQSFSRSRPATNDRHAERDSIRKAPVLPADLRQRLYASGATSVELEAVAGAPNAILCRCQVALAGTPYMRRFESRDATAELAGRRLLLDVQTWHAARISMRRARD